MMQILVITTVLIVISPSTDIKDVTSYEVEFIDDELDLSSDPEGGNQRELARQKNLKKQQEANKKQGADCKAANKGKSLEERRHRDAEMMRMKQKKADEKAPETSSSKETKK